MKHPVRKKWGQNFLIDQNIQNKIVNLLDLTDEDEVVEIGPGYGALTKIIAPKCKTLNAVEIDPLLANELQKADLKNFRIINQDFLEMDLGQFSEKVKFIGNLPYYITTPILFKILETGNWEKCVFMIQKEVALRLTSEPKNKKYGRLTVTAGLLCNVKYEFKVSPNVFKPRPEVDSAIISITKENKKKYTKEFIHTYQEIVKLAFSKRRKVLNNTIKDFLIGPAENYSRFRPEACSVSDFEFIVNTWIER